MNPSTRRTLETFILSTAELSALTGIPMITLQQQAFRGQIDSVRKGHTLLFDRRDFAEPIRQQAQQKKKQEIKGCPSLAAIKRKPPRTPVFSQGVVFSDRLLSGLKDTAGKFTKGVSDLKETCGY